MLDQEVNKNPFCHLTAAPTAEQLPLRGPPRPFVSTDATARLRRDNKNLQPRSGLLFSSPDRREPNGP